MCRLFALTSRDPVSPMLAIDALNVMKEGHDGSGVGLYLSGLGGPFGEMKECPILSGIFTEAGLGRLDEYMEGRGFRPERSVLFTPKSAPPTGTPSRGAYAAIAYEPPAAWADMSEDERGGLLVRTRLGLRAEGERTGDMMAFSFWPDTIMIKEVGDPLEMGSYLELGREELHARRILAQGRQNTNYAINLYACHPFFVEGISTMTNGENTAFVPIKEYLMSRGVEGYSGYQSDSEVFTHIAHFTTRKLGLDIRAYKHVITPLSDDEMRTHQDREFLVSLKRSCRKLIIDGPNCVIGCLPDGTMFMVQDRKKTAPRRGGGQSRNRHLRFLVRDMRAQRRHPRPRQKQRFSTHASRHRNRRTRLPGGCPMLSERPVTPATLGVKDLPWQIKWNIATCTKCGRCTAVCPVNAIELGVFRKREINAPMGLNSKPTNTFSVYYGIRQRTDPAYACIGCAMCAMVCPNNAIEPTRQYDSTTLQFHNNRGGQPRTRGGRRNNGESLLDQIKFIRISMLTDPALDAGRHEFDMRTLLGRVLSPEDEIRCQRDNGWKPPVREIYPLVIGGMSFGALSPNMWEGLQMGVAYLNEELGMPVRICTGEGGCPPRLLRSRFLKYVILQIASGYFGWDEIIHAIPEMKEDPCAIEIKYGQGAKPGDGGLLMWYKVNKLIAAIRGVPTGVSLPSPPTHQTQYSIEESVAKMIQSMSMAWGFRVPVYPKISASSTSLAVLNNLVRNPYAAGLAIDGEDGGTGAAYNVSMNHMGHPIASNLRDCYKALCQSGAQNEIPLIAGGGIGKHGKPGGQRRGAHHARREHGPDRQVRHAGGRGLRGQRERPLQRLQHRRLPQGHHLAGPAHLSPPGP